MSQVKLSTDTDQLRGLAGGRYSGISIFLLAWKLLSLISAFGWVLVVLALNQNNAIDDKTAWALGITGLIYSYFLFSVVSFVRPLVDAAVNSYVNEELLKENTDYVRQLVEIEKFKLKRSGQMPSESP